MEYKKFILFLTTCTTIVFLAIFAAPVSALSEKNRNTFSFRFENCTVTEALREISENSGIDIISNGTLKKEILIKSFVNRSLDSIIADLLRGENCAVAWNYSDGNLYSIDLFTPDEDGLKRTGTRTTSISRTGRDNVRNAFSGNRSSDRINEIRGNYLRNRETNRQNRPNTNRSTSRTTFNKEVSTSRTSLNRSYTTGVDRKKSAVSGTSDTYANIRRATVKNKQNTETEEEKEAINPQPSPTSSESPESSEPSELSESSGLPEQPETPEPEKGNGLERPPMPPGL